jgi:hypothetical protein
MVKKASKLNVPLPESLKKYAYLDDRSFSSDFGDHIAIRSNNTPDDEAKAAYDKLYKKHTDMGPVKVATLLYEIDKCAYLDRHYGSKIEDPIISTLGIEKEAEFEVDGKYFTTSDLKKLASKDLSGWIDRRTASELTGPDGPEIFISLPKPIREGLFNEMGN